jgi:hypothetical protein
VSNTRTEGRVGVYEAERVDIPVSETLQVTAIDPLYAHEPLRRRAETSRGRGRSGKSRAVDLLLFALALGIGGLAVALYLGGRGLPASPAMAPSAPPIPTPGLPAAADIAIASRVLAPAVEPEPTPELPAAAAPEEAPAPAGAGPDNPAERAEEGTGAERRARPERGVRLGARLTSERVRSPVQSRIAIAELRRVSESQSSRPVSRTEPTTVKRALPPSSPAPAPAIPEPAPASEQRVEPAVPVVGTPLPLPLRPAPAAGSSGPAPERTTPAVTRPRVVEPVVLDAMVSTQAIRVEGSLQDSVVERAIVRAHAGFRSCYQRAAELAARNGHGTVSVLFTIDEVGRASNVRIRSSSLPGLSACLTAEASKMRTRIPPDVGVVNVSFELRFAPLR